MQKPQNEMYGDMEKNVHRSMPNSTVLTQTQTHVKKHTTPPLILTHTHAHTEKPSLTHTQSHAQSLTQSHTLTQTQTHTLTQTLTQGVRQSSGESSSQSHSQSPRRLPKCGYEVRGYEVSNLNKNNRVSTETQPFVRATRTNNNNINNNSNSINQEDNNENENENDWERKFREVEDNIPDTAKISRAEVELERERQSKLHVITNTSKNILPASNNVSNYYNGSNGNNNNIDENNKNNNNNNNTNNNNNNNNNKMHTNGSITVTFGAGVRLSDDELIELLSQPPKNSTALRTKSSYLEFFRGMSSKRMVSLLERGFDKMSGRELEEREREREKERENEKEREKETQHGGGGGGGESVGESVCVCGGSGSEKAPLTASERALKVKKRMYMLQDVLTE